WGEQIGVAGTALPRRLIAGSRMRTGTIDQDRWLADATSALESLKNLLPGWDSYDAPVPEPPAFRHAGTTLGLLHALKLWPDRIAASAEGGIAFVLARGGKYADLECLNTGEILAVTCDRGGEPEVWAVDPTTISAALERICELPRRGERP